jgi:hypothetical protein
MVNHPNRSKPQFQEGQDVEVWNGFDNLSSPAGSFKPIWREAIIVRQYLKYNTWVVVFPDNSRAFFDAEHIRRRRLPLGPPIDPDNPWGARPG